MPPPSSVHLRPELTVAADRGQPKLAGDVRWRRILGTFQINVPVSTKELMLENEELRYSIFSWIAEAIPASSRWYRVFLATCR